MKSEAYVGPRILSDGVDTAQPRLNRDGSVVTTRGNPGYSELAGRSKVVYTAMTATTGVAPGTTLGTSAAIALYNAVGSQLDLAIIQVTASYLSGTLGAGNLYLVSHAQSATTPGGTTITPVSHALGGTQASGAVAKTSATSLGTQTGIRAFANIGAMAGQPATQPWYIQDFYDGLFVVTPGGAFSIQGVAAAGTSPLMLFSITYAEITPRLS